MKNKFFLLLAIAIPAILNFSEAKAQVTVGSTNPPNHFSILDVDASNIKGGIRFPQLLRTERDTISVVGNSTTAPGLAIYNKTDSVIEFWNGNRWVRSLDVEPWQVAGTTTKASQNNENIYQMGNVGIGTNNPTSRLHISAPSNPLRVQGLTIGSSLDSLVSVNDTGLVRKRSIYSLRQDIVAPPVPVTQVFAGMIKFDVTTHTLQYYDGTKWVVIASNEFFGQNEGVVRIDSYGANVRPTLTFQDQVDMNVFKFVNYPPASITLGTNTTTAYWPENVVSPLVSDILRLQGANTTYIENPIIGQVHIWRIIGTFQNKAPGADGTITIRLTNPVPPSTFQTQQYIKCQTQTTQATFTCNFITIADELSIPTPVGSGNGYTFEIASDVKLDVVINSVTRVSQYKD